MTAIRTLAPADLPLMRAMLAMLGEAFEDPAHYVGVPAPDAYLSDLLCSRMFIAVVALDGSEVVGGIAAYELPKFEQARSDIYLYDIAVAASHRRRGIATALIAHLQQIAAARGTSVVYVQAHRDDAPAIALYTKLGVGEDVLHFDLAPDAGRD
ncbi:MAG: AAC(3)-I family aminoglycoside N-acetyltransferase [Xanthomonadaceae bacterium]|jgi:aminoglycoside 3-N-acetyltransferase I|nr:AAC(3)-I family aminoglycoside N-acetyltransferase [Xanthomonadaceae bacterium]